MEEKRGYLNIEEINDTLDLLSSNIDIEMDEIMSACDLDNDKIRMFVTERVTIKRIRSILNGLLTEVPK